MSDATEVCVAYERWASEVTRLTREISGCLCPHQVDGDDVAWEGSCFQRAKEDRANWSVPQYPDSASYTPNLAKVAEVVADCPSCSRLCELIASRKHARKQFGIAKRRVRAVGRAESKASL